MALTYRFPVVFTRQALAPGNTALAETIAAAGNGPHRMLAFIDSGAAAALPDLADQVEAYAAARPQLVQLVAPPFLAAGGEQAKADGQVVDSVLDAVYRHGICRQSFILALGGGALLDAVGFAAATAHRGVRLLRMPSTVLAQNDAGVGLKNGVNLFGRKNFWGAFAPPFAVINDFTLLQGLPQRDLRAGIAEAVKVACIRDREFFLRLHKRRQALAGLEQDALEEMIVDCAAAHLRHIATCGDPFELGSARPLDFGHWSAHALEEASHGALRHGEAVSIGVALDSVYSWLANMLPEEELELLLELLADLELPLFHELLAELDLQASLEAFREHLGGCLHVSLLESLGRGVEVTSLDMGLMAEAREELARRAARLAAPRTVAAQPGA